MRYVVFLIFLIFVGNISAKEVKIVLATLDTAKRAQNKLEKFQNLLTSDFYAIQEKEGFDVLIRPSGRYFILTIEPIQSKKVARELQKQLPKPYAKDSFVGNYSLPKRYETAYKIQAPIKTDSNTTVMIEQVEIDLGEKAVKETMEKPLKSFGEANESSADIRVKKEPQDDIQELAKKQESQKSDKELVKEAKKTTARQSLEKNTTDVKDNYTTIVKDESDLQQEKSMQDEKSYQERPKEASKKIDTLLVEQNISLKKPEKLQELQVADSQASSDDSFGATLIQGANNAFEVVARYATQVFHALKNTLKVYALEIAVLIFLISLVLFILTYRQSIILYKKIEWLKASKHEIAKDAEFLKLDINNLKTYFNGLVNSAKPSLEKLEEHFQSRNTSIEEKEARDATYFLAHVIKSYDDFGGQVILTQKEFDLNLLVKRVLASSKVKMLGCNIVADFEHAMLKKVVADSQKIGRILRSLITFCCKYSEGGRVLVVLNEVIQEAQGEMAVKIIIKNSKSIFSEEVLQKIAKAFAETSNTQQENYDEDVLDLIAVKRIVKAKRGKIKTLDNFRDGSGFVFDMKLKVMNRRIIQKNIFSNESFVKLNIVIFGNNAESVKTLQSELEFLSLDVETCFSWNQMLDSFNDIYFFIDMVIVQNATLPFVDIEALNSASKKKNFVTIVVLEEHENEGDELNQIHNKKVLKRPYEKVGLARVLNAISKEQKPATINS